MSGRAGSLPELVRTLGLPADEFNRTLARYNAEAARGEDSEFGKGGSTHNRYPGDQENTPKPCLRPIEQAPFYALCLHPGDIGTSTGIVTDEHARVLDAAGNDMNSIMAGSYPGPSITLGPALAFGYIATTHMASQTGQCTCTS